MPSLGEYLGGSLQRASSRLLPYWMDKQQLGRQKEQDAFQQTEADRQYGLQQETANRLRESLDLQKQEFEYEKAVNRQTRFLEMIGKLEADRQKGEPKPAKTIDEYAIRLAEGGDGSMLEKLLDAKTKKGQGTAKPKQPSVPDQLGLADWIGLQGGYGDAIRTWQDLNTAVDKMHGLPGFPGWSVMRKPPVGDQLRDIQKSIIGQTLMGQGGEDNPIDYAPAEEVPAPPPNDGSYSDEEYQQFIQRWYDEELWRE